MAVGNIILVNGMIDVVNGKIVIQGENKIPLSNIQSWFDSLQTTSAYSTISRQYSYYNKMTGEEPDEENENENYTTEPITFKNFVPSATFICVDEESISFNDDVGSGSISDVRILGIKNVRRLSNEIKVDFVVSSKMDVLVENSSSDEREEYRYYEKINNTLVEIVSVSFPCDQNGNVSNPQDEFCIGGQYKYGIGVLFLQGYFTISAAELFR